MDLNQQAATSARPLPPAAILALQQGRKIEAIKILRSEQPMGLKEAKDAVDTYVRTQPQLQQALVAVQARATRAALLVLLVALAIAALAYWYVARR
jgi:ribosomal protein L7/L12